MNGYVYCGPESRELELTRTNKAFRSLRETVAITPLTACAEPNDAHRDRRVSFEENDTHRASGRERRQDCVFVGLAIAISLAVATLFIAMMTHVFVWLSRSDAIPSVQAASTQEQVALSNDPESTARLSASLKPADPISTRPYSRNQRRISWSLGGVASVTSHPATKTDVGTNAHKPGESVSTQTLNAGIEPAERPGHHLSESAAPSTLRPADEESSDASVLTQPIFSADEPNDQLPATAQAATTAVSAGDGDVSEEPSERK